MKIIKTNKETTAFIAKLKKRAGSISPEIIKTTEDILSAVKRQGDKALLRYTKKFDGHDNLKLSQKIINEYANKADAKTVKALKLSAGRIKKFHALQMEKSWSVKEKGITLGQIISPLERVGVYIPGGKASYPSSVLMNVIPAQVAGVDEIAITVPTPSGIINPYVMTAIKITGIKEVYSVGGAQAVGALAYGTETIKKTYKIVGPGNIFVATAKRMVFGEVDIDMIAGPSEILIIADSSARPDFIAADLLSQAEHDELASSVLLTDSLELAGKVNAEIKIQLKKINRYKMASQSLKKYGAIIVLKNLQKAAEISNTIAPEHLEVMTKSPRKLLPSLRNAGAIFLGAWTPEPMGDYSAGPNHTLPTGATATWASPLGTYDFLTRSSLLEFTREGFMSLAEPVETIAEKEGLDAHARSVSIRREKH